MARTRINRRLVNSKRHTTGFVITGNRRITRSEAVRMAKQNQIAGVRVVRGADGPYLMSTGKRSLYSLPVAVENGSSRSRRRS